MMIPQLHHDKQVLEILDLEYRLIGQAAVGVGNLVTGENIALFPVGLMLRWFIDPLCQCINLFAAEQILITDHLGSRAAIADYCDGFIQLESRKVARQQRRASATQPANAVARSEERRVGKACLYQGALSGRSCKHK